MDNEDKVGGRVKEFIAPGGTRFVFERDSDWFLIMDGHENKIQVPKEDLVALVKYVKAEQSNKKVMELE